MGQNSSSEKKEIQNIKQMMQEQFWSQYPVAQLMGTAPNQTARFFANPIASERLLSSDKQIVQFGVAGGKYLAQPSFSERTRVGYDYTETSACMVPFKHHLIDLEDSTDGTLNYQQTIDDDLSVPCDILLIRLLEYLDTDAATLLLASLIASAKPSSTFYIDFNKASTPSPVAPNTWHAGSVVQFFQPEENFKIDMHSIQPELGNEYKNGLTETLVVTKLA